MVSSNEFLLVSYAKYLSYLPVQDTMKVNGFVLHVLHSKTYYPGIIIDCCSLENIFEVYLHFVTLRRHLKDGNEKNWGNKTCTGLSLKGKWKMI